jgi:uncharacterized protein
MDLNQILSPTEQAACTERMRSLLDDLPAALGVFLATDDGFEITQVISGRALDPARLAAMSSSIIALGHAMVEETGLGETENFFIEARLGKILLLNIDARIALSMTVIAKPTATLGQVLMLSKRCAQELLALLQR